MCHVTCGEPATVPPRLPRWRSFVRPAEHAAEVLACGAVFDLVRNDPALNLRVFLLRHDSAETPSWVDVLAAIEKDRTP